MVLKIFNLLMINYPCICHPEIHSKFTPKMIWFSGKITLPKLIMRGQGPFSPKIQGNAPLIVPHITTYLTFVYNQIFKENIPLDVIYQNNKNSFSSMQNTSTNLACLINHKNTELNISYLFSVSSVCTNQTTQYQCHRITNCLQRMKTN